MIVFTFIDHIVNSSIKLKYQHCDARQIQEYYMNNFRYKKKKKFYSVYNTLMHRLIH